MSLSKLSDFSISTLAIVRMAVGGAGLLVPTHAAPLFGVSLTTNTIILARLFGIRDFLLGGYLWNARQRYVTSLSGGKMATGEVGVAMSEAAKGELKRVLWLGIVADAVDMSSCLFGWMNGSLEMHALIGIGAGAMLYVELGLLALRGCRIMV